MNSRDLERVRRLLCRLQAHLRDRVLAARRRPGVDLARVVGVTSADTIYRLDRIGEQAVLAWLAAHWPRGWPVEVVMEGLEDGGAVTFPRGTPTRSTHFKCILDPVDGTRGLMYDKRSAWSLAGLAPQRGAKTSLADIVVAAMTELPTSSQWRSRQLSAVRGRGVQAREYNVLTGASRATTVRPSRAHDCRGGFAALSRFFPAGKTRLARLEEQLWAELYGTAPVIFDDQYLSTGGQLHELIAGHDRFLADLRPLVLAPGELTCHPYDICTALIAREAGCVVEDPCGGVLRMPLDTTTPVTWAGYANPTLARHIRPVLRRLIRRVR
jgi:fructose-1,6-bisphosphatase/inositol monophosphatase family enzyme